MYKESILKTILLSHDFIESYIDSDITRMKSLVSNLISIDNDELIITYEGFKDRHKIVDDVIGYSLNSFGKHNDNVFYQYTVLKGGK